MKNIIFEGLDVILLELINFLQEIEKNLRPEPEKDEELKDLNLPILTFFEDFSVNFFLYLISFILKNIPRKNMQSC